MKDLIKLYFSPYKKSLAVILILVIVQVILQILIINLIKPIMNKGINDIDDELILSFGVALVLLIVVYSVITYIVAHMAAVISAESVSKIRKDMFRKLLSFKRPRDSGANMSGLMTRLINDVNNIQTFIREFLCMGLYVPLLAIGIIIVSATFKIYLCAAITVAFILMIAYIYYLAKGEKQTRSKMQRLFDRTIYLFDEMLLGARTARSFDMEDGQMETFSEQNKVYSDFQTQVTVKASNVYLMSTVILVLSVIMVFSVLIPDPENVAMTSADLIILIQYLVLFITCVSISSFLITTVPEVKASLSRISKVMNGESEPGGLHVNDAYDGEILRCSNGLVIERGQEHSLVGRTSSGKSELIRDLLRLDDVDHGSIFFKGTDIMDLDPKELRRSIAYAGNLALTFRGTIKSNIRISRDISDERIQEAMEAALIDMEPDRMLDISGANISNGQRQKVSIARALATDADLYIFDDCFTELDPKTENEIVSNIRGMLKGKTVLFSSHGFRTSPGSDRISVMSDGIIIDAGSHDELLERCDIYRRMQMMGGGVLE